MAEKKAVKAKSTRRKNVDKKKDAIPAETIQQIEKSNEYIDVNTLDKNESPKGVDWNVIGFVSVAITLLGSGLLFMLGWAYESNWYGFFGLNMSQVAIQPQDVIIQSIPGVVTIISCLFMAAVSYYFFHLVFGLLIKVKNRREVDDALLVIPQKQTKTLRTEYSFRDWLFVSGITELILLYFLFFVYAPDIGEKMGESQALLSIYEMNYIILLTLIPLLVVAVIGVLSMTILVLVYFGIDIYTRIRKYFVPTTKIIIDDLDTEKVPQKLSIMFFIVSLILLTSLTLSAMYGINDAASGKHTGTWRVQRVKIISATDNPFLQMGLSYCYPKYCESIPFGLIGENDKSYILIRWDKINDEYFPYNTGIILLPRSDDVILVPSNYGQ